MNKINISDYKNIILNAALIFIALLIAARIYKTQSAIVGSVSSQREELGKKNAMFSDINQAATTLNSYSKFFGRKDMSSVIDTINMITKDAGIKVASIKPEKEQDYAQYMVKYSFKVEAIADSYHAIGKFVSGLENYAGIYYRIDSIKIGIPEKTQSEPAVYSLKAELKISNFSLKN